MDEEDVRDAEDSRALQTADTFTGFGATEDDSTRRAGLMDLLMTSGDTMGVKLLKKMGWKEGQGIGPKVRRRADLGDNSMASRENNGSENTTFLFAPKNPPMVSFVHKTDHKGLGYEGEARLEGDGRALTNNDSEDETAAASDPLVGRRQLTAPNKPKQKSKDSRRGGIGVGVLNDTGSDDEDPYSLGPPISYNRTIGADKMKKKKKNSGKQTEDAKPMIASSNPLLGSRPVFISKKTAAARNATGFRKCHDGRLPLDGFSLAQGMSSLSLSSLGKSYAPPEVPKDWKSSKSPLTPSTGRDVSNYVSTKEAAKASTLDPTSRAAMLGEAQLPGKSVFDWMTAEGRERIARLTGKKDLPPALGEKAPKGHELTEAQKRKDLWDLVPKLDKTLAVQALTRAISGWMPYAEDQEKRSRYRTFLEVRAGVRDNLPDRVTGSSTDEWIAELEEFTRAAEVFKPMSGIMASRFTSASTEPKSTSAVTGDPLLQKPTEKPEDPAVAAAKIGMFGPMTRSSQTFYPTRLLCKRFNVKPPAHVQQGTDEGPAAYHPGSSVGSRFQSAGYQTPSGTKELVPQDVMDQLKAETSGARNSGSGPIMESGEEPSQKQTMVEPERNTALEAERPGEAVFKAIFGSDDDEEEEDEG